MPTTSCPSTWGKEISAVIELSEASPPSVSMKTCLASEPQMPVILVSSTTQSGPRGRGSSMSVMAMGVSASALTNRLASAAGADCGSGRTPNTNPLTSWSSVP